MARKSVALLASSIVLAWIAGCGGGAGTPSSSSSPEDDSQVALDSGSPLAKPGKPPTWNQVFDRYFAAGTVGGCVGCHSDLAAADGLYTYLSGLGQIDGTSSPIVTSSSYLTWFGGFMPPNGPSSDPAAEEDMKAWVAAGAKQE